MPMFRSGTSALKSLVTGVQPRRAVNCGARDEWRDEEIIETVVREARRRPLKTPPIHCLRRTTESPNGLVLSGTNRHRLKAATPPNRRIAPWTVHSSLVRIAR